MHVTASAGRRSNWLYTYTQAEVGYQSDWLTEQWTLIYTAKLLQKKEYTFIWKHTIFFYKSFQFFPTLPLKIWRITFNFPYLYLRRSFTSVASKQKINNIKRWTERQKNCNARLNQWFNEMSVFVAWISLSLRKHFRSINYLCSQTNCGLSHFDRHSN